MVRAWARVRGQATPAKEKRPEPSPDVSLPFYRKLLLLAVLMGNEACVSFQQLYEIPLLLILGIPAPLVSLYPVICGPIAMLLMIGLGYYSDQGRNHQYRKIIVLVFNSALTLGGIILLVAANLIFVSSSTYNRNGTGFIDDKAASTETAENAASVVFSFNYTTQSAANLSFPAKRTDNSTSFALPSLTQHAAAANESTRSREPETESGLFDLPLTAVIGLLGFCLMDIGYDTLCASARSCVLACSPRVDHTALLVLALVMAALGGCYNCGFGVIDLSHVIHLGAAEGSLIEQTTVQLALCSLIMITTLTSTVIASLHNIWYGNHSDYVALSSNTDTDSDGYAEKCYGSVGNSERRDTFIDTQDNSANLTGDKTTSLKKPHCTLSELSASTGVNAQDKYEREVTLYRSTDQFLFKDHGSVSAVPSSSNQHWPQGRKFCGLDDLKANFAIACAAAYFGTSVVFSYNLFVSEFIGTVMMGGDSAAAPGSPELTAYEKGVSLASSGLLLFFCSYIAASALQSKLLQHVGLRLEFCLSQAVMAAAILFLVLSEKITAFYVACVLYGFHRSALYSVPFLVAQNYIQEKNLGDKGGSALGKVVAVVTCMIPLNYCTLFLLSGPLVYLTSNDGAPLLLAAASACVSACVFAIYGRI